MRQMNLTEATLLALQGKLKLTESTNKDSLWNDFVDFVKSKVEQLQDELQGEPLESDTFESTCKTIATDFAQENGLSYDEVLQDKYTDYISEQLEQNFEILDESKELKTESIEVETDNTEVTVDDTSTVVETPEETITVEKKNTECIDCEQPTEVIEVPKETVVEPVDQEITVTDVDTTPENTDSTDINNDVEDTPVADNTEETTSEETVEEPVEDEDLDESKEIKTENFDTFDELQQAVKNSGGLYGFIYNEFGNISKELLKEIALNAVYELSNDELILSDLKERLYEAKDCENCGNENKDQCVETVDRKSFEIRLKEYFTSKDQNIKDVKVEKILKNNKALKLECNFIDLQDNSTNRTIIVDKLTEGKYFTKYKLRMDKTKITESKEDTQSLNITTFKNTKRNNVLHCADVF